MLTSPSRLLSVSEPVMTGPKPDWVLTSPDRFVPVKSLLQSVACKVHSHSHIVIHRNHITLILLYKVPHMGMQPAHKVVTCNVNSTKQGKLQTKESEQPSARRIKKAAAATKEDIEEDVSCDEG